MPYEMREILDRVEPAQADEHLWAEEFPQEYIADIVDKANKERAMHPDLEPLPKPEPVSPVKPKVPRKPSQRKKQAIIKESIKPTTDVEKEDK